MWTCMEENVEEMTYMKFSINILLLFVIVLNSHYVRRHM